MTITLTNFQAQIHDAVRDLKATKRYPTTLINNQLDKWIRRVWPDIVKQVPRHYYTVSSEYTGITDAQDSANELYLLPDGSPDAQFRSAAVLRRTDLTEKPPLHFINPQDQNIFRFGKSNYFQYAAEAPAQTDESWSIFDATQFKILPAPASTSYTYKLEYWRQHTTVTTGGTNIDIPTEAESAAIDAVALACARMMNEGGSLISQLEKEAEASWKGFMAQEQKAFHAAVADCRRFWV